MKEIKQENIDREFDIVMESIEDTGMCDFKTVFQAGIDFVYKQNIKNKVYSFNPTDLEILRTEFIDINSKTVRELDITKVRGSVRIRTAQLMSEDDVSEMKSRVNKIKFPYLKK